MNLREVDLNLLVALDILLEERQVGVAAARLGISQPSASAALDRCRRLFGDPLLVRAGRGMQLTARGKDMQGPVRELLADLRAILGEQQQTLATTKRLVRLVAADMPAQKLLQELWKKLQITAPGMDLCLLTWRDSDDVLAALVRDRADLAISVLPQTGGGFRRVELFTETYAAVMRKDHPAAQDLTLESWLAYPHIIVSATGALRTPLDDQLALMGLRRRVGMVVPSFLMVPELLSSSTLIAMLPKRFIAHKHDLAYCVPPLDVKGFQLHLAWAIRAEKDAAVQHVAQLIREIMSDYGNEQP